MKKITLFTFFLLSGFFSQAQISFEASGNYGKLQDITYDATVQNKMYAASQGNHIVVSLDNGVSWNVLYSYPGEVYIKDLKLALNNTALAFSTGDALHFLDLATNTLTQSLPVPQSGVVDAGPSYISSYSVFDSNVILVDTGFQVGWSNFGKTFYTYDGGENWVEIYYTLDHDNVFINNVAISPNNSTHFFLCRGNGDTDIDGGIWSSDDSGSSWTQNLAGVTLSAIAFNPTNANDILLGSFIGFGIHPENLYRSSDGGVNWDIVPITWTDVTLNNITKIAFHPTNPNKIILLEENEVVISNNGGTTWTNIVYPVEAGTYYYGLNVSFNPNNENQLAISTDLFPQFSNDGGTTLSQIKAPFYNVISTSTATYNGNTSVYYGSNGGLLHKDITTGVTTAYDIEGPDSFNPKKNYMVADPIVAGRVFNFASMGFFGGNLNVSTDYGATKTILMDSFAEAMEDLTVDPNNTNIIYVSMRSGESSSVYKIDFSDLTNIISTEIITPQINEFGEGVVTGIVISPANSDVMFIAKKTKVYMSTDAGVTWEEKSSGLEGLNSATDLIWDMSKNPLDANQMTIATNIGIFTTTDAAESWSAILPGLDVKRIKHSPLNNGVIVGSVFNTMFLQASIVYTIDNGVNWTTVTPEQLNYVQSYAMDYNFSGNSIDAYIATTDLGLMKYPITEIPLSVNNPELKNTIGIYPNPASSQIRVFSSKSAAINNVVLFSLTGQKVMESKTASLDVSGLSNGIYLVKATTANGESFTQKLVKE